MASLRKSERHISSRGHRCFTISPLQLPVAATRFPSHGSGQLGLELRTATKLSSAGFEPMAVLTFGLRVRRLNHTATRSLGAFIPQFAKYYSLSYSLQNTTNVVAPIVVDGFIIKKIWFFAPRLSRLSCLVSALITTHLSK